MISPQSYLAVEPSQLVQHQKASEVLVSMSGEIQTAGVLQHRGE